MSKCIVSSPIAASTPNRAGRLMRTVVLCLFVVAALNSALRKDITRGFDEVAHVSYVAQLQSSGETPPRLDELRLLAPSTFQFTETPSYLNHPPPYYWLLARLSPTIKGHPDALIVLRLWNIVIASCGLAFLLLLGASAKLNKQEEYAWYMPIFAIPVLAPIAGSVNNDNLAFAGGALALFATHQLLTTGRARWLMTALAAMIIASFAKLTGLLLVGALVVGVIAVMAWRGQHQPWRLIATLVAGLIAAAPYFVLWSQYGGPAPETAGQIALLKSTAAENSWENAPRLSLAAYAATFVATFIAQWMPTLGERTGFQYAMLIVPAAAVLCGLSGLSISARRLMRGEETSTDVIIVAGSAAIAATFVCHLVFSYRHHLAYAYIPDAYPRYYLPLVAIVPLAGLSLLSAVRNARFRSNLAGFLIGGPVALALFGAP